MNWAAFTAIIALVTLLVVIGGIIFVSGKMVEKTNANTGQLALHSNRLDGHDDHLGRVDVALAKLERYEAGFQAATNLIGKQQHPET